MIRDICRVWGAEVAKWVAVDFYKTQLVKEKTFEKDIDECPSIFGAGGHT